MKPNSVFVIAIDGDRLAMTTRPDGGMGFPGGKVDEGELLVNAVYREAAEEGWSLHGPLTQVYSADFEGMHVVWYLLEGDAKQLTKYKEQHRGIRPIWVVITDAARHPDWKKFGNDRAIAAVLGR